MPTSHGGQNGSVTRCLIIASRRWSFDGVSRVQKERDAMEWKPAGQGACT